MPIVKYLDKNLRYLRRNRNMSQEEFAQQVGLNRGNIASYEKGAAEPQLENLIRIVRFLGVDAIDFVERDLTTTKAYPIKNMKSVATKNGPSAKAPAQTKRLKKSPKPVVVIEAAQSTPNGSTIELPSIYREQAKELLKIKDHVKVLHEFKISKYEKLSKEARSFAADFDQLLEITEDLIKLNQDLMNIFDAEE